MSYPGWLMFAGTEIANVARTVAYARHALPSMVVIDTYDSEDLHLLLGDGAYSSPQSDLAPWYSPYDPDSAEFFGFYPLAVQGLDDSSVDVTVTQLTGDGAVLSRARHASKSVRVSGLILGASEAALTSGKRWLRGVLASPDCVTGDCNGADLCYMSHLPEWCDYSEYLDTPVDVTNLSTERVLWDAVGAGVVTTGTDSLVFGPGAASGARRYVEGLIPGQAYRVALDLVSSSPTVRVEVSGVASQVFNSTAEGDLRTLGVDGPYVVDFIAAHTEHVVTITQGSVGSTSVYQMRVSRTAGLRTTALLTFPSHEVYEPGSWVADSFPVGVTYRGTLATTDAFGDHLVQEYVTATTASVTSASDLYRPIRGLTAGRQYTLTMGVGAHTAASIRVKVGTEADTVALVDGAAPTWVQHTFTATGPTMYVAVGFNTATTTTSATPAKVLLSYLRVDLDDPEAPFVEPDFTSNVLRTYRHTGLIDGPRVVEEYALTAGAMERIEFSIELGSPHAYAPLVEIPPDVNGTYAVIPDTACSLGQPVRRNLLSNPSFETNATGWVGDNGTIARVTSSPYAVAGTAAGRVTVAGTVTVMAARTSATVAVTPNAAYTFSVYVTSSIAAQITARIGSAATFLSSVAERVYTLAPGQTTRVQVTAVMDATQSTATVAILMRNASGTGNIPSGASFSFDAAQLESGVFASPYFDGASGGGAWVGTAHASQSTWTSPSVALIVDPDCTPIPPPPRAPLVLDDCIEAPDTWRRYYVTIPAQEVPASSAALPVVTLTTGASDVRQIRLRFTAVPFQTRVDEMNPCDYCGEFIVSYIPANSTMVIDSTTEQANIDVASTGTQTAQNLVYGTDGGPITWPTLSCEVQYVMTVDVSPTLQDLDVRLALARRD